MSRVLFIICIFASSTAHCLEAKQYLNFKIVIPLVLFFKSSTTPQNIEVTETDVSRGYVDIPVDYVIVSNGDRGFAFGITLADAFFFDAFEITSFSTGKISKFSSSADTKGLPNREIRIVVPYRLWLKGGAIVPGRYAWPIASTLSAR